MSVLINFKICDNSPECGGISVCPTKALKYDNKKKTIVIDNDKCISCGKCIYECPVSAIHVTKNDIEYIEVKNEIDNDSRKIKDLFVDRYGATPISDYFILKSHELNRKLQYNGLSFIEVYTDDSIECLLKSIPIKELTKDINEDIQYFKLNPSTELVKKYAISIFPSLLIFRKDKLIGKIEGYFPINMEKEMISKILMIIS